MYVKQVHEFEQNRTLHLQYLVLIFAAHRFSAPVLLYCRKKYDKNMNTCWNRDLNHHCQLEMNAIICNTQRIQLMSCVRNFKLNKRNCFEKKTFSSFTLF